MSVKKHFWTGVAVLLPVAVTIAIANFVVEFLTTPFQKVYNKAIDFLGLGDIALIASGSNLLILLFIFLLTVVLGIIVNWFISQRILKFTAALLFKIPFIGTIYKASREVVHTLIDSPTNSFKQVVMVPFPSENSYTIGFLVNEAPVKTTSDTHNCLMSVFVPTTPNPTTGFIMMFAKDKVHSTSLSVEEALKYIISCGMIVPPSSQTLSTEK